MSDLLGSAGNADPAAGTKDATQGGDAGAAADKAAADAAAAQTPEQKVAAEKLAADKAAADKAASLPPEKYAFKAPEGVKLPEDWVTDLSSVAKELGLPQDKANKVNDLAIKYAQKRDADLKAGLEKVNAGWVEASKADKEFGGANLEQNLGVAKKAMDAFASPELKALLTESGLGNHPEMIRAFFRVGKAISEDKLVLGKLGAPAGQNSGTFTYENSKHA